MKDKIGGGFDAPDFSGAVTAAPVQSGNLSLATSALQELGYSPAEVAMALKGADPNADAQDLIRFALKAMMTK